MKKKIFALLTALCMTAAVLPAVFADGEGEATIGMSEQEHCSCVVLCTEDNKNPDCPVCSAEGAELDKVCVGAALMLPVTALAAEGAPVSLYVAGQQITDEGYYTQSGGNWTKSGDASTPTSAPYFHYTKGNDNTPATLTLSGATIQGGTSTGTVPYGAGIYAQCSNGQSVTLTIKLIGENTITGYYGIYVNAEISEVSNGTDASLTITSENNGSLEVSGSYYGIFVKSGTGNASVTIENASVDAKTTQTSSGYAGVCVQSGASATTSPNISLSVNGGSLTASGGTSGDGIQFVVGSHQATGATTSLTVSDNAIVRANGGIANNSSSPIQYGTDSSTTGGIVFDGTEGTVYGNVTLQEDLEIGEGESLTLDDGANLSAGDHNVIVDGGTLDENLANSLGNSVKYAPTITTQPTSQTVTEGETATFNVEATGTDLTYQWQQKTDGGAWSDISGANSETYTIETTTMDMSGTQYRCVVENSIDEVTSDAATLTVQQAGVPIPPQPTDPTTPETTAPTDTDHTVQTDNSGHAPVEDNTALPSFWDLVTQRINATPRGGEITINMGARAVPDSVLNALRARKLTATFRYGDTELTLTPDQLPPEGALTEWTLHELGNYVTESDESIRISEEKSEAENQAAAAETTAPAADTGKPNPATGETTTTATALLVAVVALTGLGVTLKKK